VKPFLQGGDKYWYMIEIKPPLDLSLELGSKNNHYTTSIPSLFSSLTAAGLGGGGTFGQGFFNASCIMTKHPLGPLTAPDLVVSEQFETRGNTHAPCTMHNNNSFFCIYLHHLQALYGIPLSAHISSHLLARIHSAATALTLTRRTHASVAQGHTMGSVLPVHSPSLHNTLKPFSFAITPRVDELALHKPISFYLFAHSQQSFLVRDSELL
jgi:hypothetical protein